MANELVTVFGASGFVGRHLVRRLARDGYRVRAAVRRPHEAPFLKPMGDVGQIHLYQTNIRDEASTARAIEGADHVINLVGILAESGPQRFATVHVQGADRVARLAKEHGVERLVHMSAIGADPDSTSNYGRTKAAGEAAVRAQFPKAVIMRPSIIFGPEDQFFNRFAAMAVISPFLPLIGGGRTRFQPVHVGDVAMAFAKALAMEKSAGKTYELGGPHIYTFRELMEYILEETNRRRLLLPIPFGMAKALAALTGWLPGAPITTDQVEQLKYDNVVSKGATTFKALGITPDSVEANVPAYIWRFRKSGRFTPVAP